MTVVCPAHYIELVTIAKVTLVAWCPRACPELVEGFASVFWTLTWAEEGSGRPTEHFQLTISGRPFRFNLHHSVDPRLAQQRGEPGAPGAALAEKKPGTRSVSN